MMGEKKFYLSILGKATATLACFRDLNRRRREGNLPTFIIRERAGGNGTGIAWAS